MSLLCLLLHDWSAWREVASRAYTEMNGSLIRVSFQERFCLRCKSLQKKSTRVEPC